MDEPNKWGLDLSKVEKPAPKKQEGVYEFTFKFLQQKESEAQITLNQYLRESKMPGFFELKVGEKDKFYFSKIEECQLEGLQATEKEGLVWKLSDMDPRQKPCDTLSIPPGPSYLVIKFGSEFFFIRIKEIIKLKELSHIAITRDQARELAEKIVEV